MPDLGDYDQTPRSSAEWSPREGQFSNIWTFMTKPEDGNSSLELPRRADGIYGLGSGSIILIDHEVDASIHARVMVIIRKGETSFSCLTFCLHTGSRKPKDHWQVVGQRNAGNAVRDLPSDTIEIVLEPCFANPSRTAAVSPQPHITINTQDVWDIERGLPVYYLGFVQQASMRTLVMEHLKLYHESLCRDLQPDEGPEQTRAEKSRGRRQKR